MDTRLLEYYNQELQYIREMGAEFAEAYPRIAARLGIDGIECADPYVERLIESFAFLAARVQLKLDARHPEFTQHLLEMIYPHFLAPVPSCAVVELVPESVARENAVIPFSEPWCAWPWITRSAPALSSASARRKLPRNG